MLPTKLTMHNKTTITDRAFSRIRVSKTQHNETMRLSQTRKCDTHSVVLTQLSSPRTTSNTLSILLSNCLPGPEPESAELESLKYYGPKFRALGVQNLPMAMRLFRTKDSFFPQMIPNTQRMIFMLPTY